MITELSFNGQKRSIKTEDVDQEREDQEHVKR